MSKTIKITDLQTQQSQMQTMANELESAKQLIVKSIGSMRNAGIDSISPLGTAKLSTLLTVINTQIENLEVGIKVLQLSIDSMQNVDISIRKNIEKGIIKNERIIGVASDWTKPSSQIVEDDIYKDYQVVTPDLNSIYYNRFYRNPDPNQGGGQCTGYTKGRIYELLGIDFLADVWDWGGRFALGASEMGKGDFISVQKAIDGEILNLNCPAVCSNTGHVLVIEKVENEGGKINIIFSEANSGWAIDGEIQSLSWENFCGRYFADGMGNYPAGFLRIRR